MILNLTKMMILQMMNQQNKHVNHEWFEFEYKMCKKQE